ncbi:MAG: iron ABC transporter permease [Breznakibacter sp.]
MPAKTYIRIGYAILFILLLVLFVVNLVLGSVMIPMEQLQKLLFSMDKADEIVAQIIFKSRLPQTITAILAGAALAVAGLQMQTLFRNPLADPSILGISSGASLGVAFLVMMTSSLGVALIASWGLFGHMALVVTAFLGAFTVLLIILNLSRKINNNAVLLIVGIMIGYGSGAVIDVLKFLSPKEDVYAFVIWGMGSFSNVTNSQLLFMAPVALIGLTWSLFMTKHLNIMLLGDNYGTNLGLNIKTTRFLILSNTGLLTALITAFCGPIAFIGLAVPHLVKALMKTSDHAILLPSVIMAGATLALACNFIARLPGFDGTLPINSVTAFMGAPVVVWVLLKRRKENGF